jgi:hypothetical protein
MMLLLLPLLASFPSAADLQARLLEIHAQGDRDACATLFRERPGEVLPALEAELEAALALREGGRAEDVPEARAREERAVWAAGIAGTALDAPLVADLVVARAGWTEGERRLFREERMIHAKAVGWIEKGENRFGLEAAQEVTIRALALGDWRGAAMGYEAAAIAHQALSSFDDALVAWSRARVAYRELALAAEELACQRAVVDMCTATERWLRGREAADQGASIAVRLGSRKAQAELLGRRAACEAKLGLEKEAAATRAAAEKLGG